MEMAEIIYVKDANWNLVQTTIKDLREDRLKKLEEENKKLKEIIRKNVNGCPYWWLYCGQYLGL